MALYHNAESPGEWQSFIKRNDIRNLSLQEQKKKYLIEQLQFDDFVSQQLISRQLAFNSLSAQNRVAGNIDNKVINAVFNATPTLQTITENTTFIDVVFQNPVLVDDSGGVPTISVTNGKQGGGSVSPVVYTYVNNASQSKLVRFSHTHPASPNNDGGIAAHVIRDGEYLDGAVTSNTLSGIPGGGVSATNVVFTAAQGTGGTGFQNITADVSFNLPGTEIAIIEFVASASAATYSPGQTLTATAAQIGLGGTGEVVITLRDRDCQPDILTMVGSTIAENGGEIYSAANNPGAQLDLSYTSTSTKISSAT